MYKYFFKLILINILILVVSSQVITNQIQVSEDCKKLNAFLNKPINTQCCGNGNQCDQEGYLTELEICL